LAGNDGRKMSKSLGNYTDPNLLMDQYSADSLRFLMLSSPVLATKKIPIIKATNTSVGVNIVNEIVAFSTKLLKDTNIIEYRYDKVALYFDV